MFQSLHYTLQVLQFLDVFGPVAIFAFIVEPILSADSQLDQFIIFFNVRLQVIGIIDTAWDVENKLFERILCINSV